MTETVLDYAPLIIGVVLFVVAVLYMVSMAKVMPAGKIDDERYRAIVRATIKSTLRDIILSVAIALGFVYFVLGG